MSCTALPGYYCQPLYNTPTICPENWYCPGGTAMARKCPDNRWSAVASIYPEDCREHMTLNTLVALVLLFMLLSLGICIWLAAWEWDDRDRRAYKYAEYGPPYGEVTVRGVKYAVHHTTLVNKGEV